VAIDEANAWRILESYCAACAAVDSDSLMAIYAIGSLPAGYYRPGQSDIDAVLIVRDGSEGIWGNINASSERLAGLNAEYQRHYGIPKSFGPFPLEPHELHPPYDADKTLTLEIARLKVQGEIVYGDFSLEDVPMPTREDYLADFRRFEDYWDNDFSKKTPVERMTAVQCVNTILIHLHRYLIVEKGIIEFDKRRIVPSCTVRGTPFLYQPALDLVRRHLETGKVSEEETTNLRQYVSDLRHNMNALLGIR
jgi:hypothetical protein